MVFGPRRQGRGARKILQVRGGCSALNKQENLSLPRMSLHASKSWTEVVCKQTNQLPCVPGKIICGSTLSGGSGHSGVSLVDLGKKRPGVPVSRVFAGGRCGVHPRAIFLIIPGFINYFPEDKLSFRQSPWAEKSGQAIDTPLWILHMSLQPRAE